MNGWVVLGIAAGSLVVGYAGGIATSWKAISGIRSFARDLQTQLEWTVEAAPRGVCAVEASSIGDLVQDVVAFIPNTPRERSLAAAGDLRERADQLDRDAARYRREAAEFDSDVMRFAAE